MFSINCPVHKTHQETPFYLLRGYEPRKSHENKYLLDFTERDIDHDRKVCRERLLNAQIQVYQQRLAQANLPTYKIGDFVFIKNMFYSSGENKKTRPKYSGPYLIIDIIGATLKVVSLDGREIKKINCDLTKPRTGIMTREMINILEKFKDGQLKVDSFENSASEE